MQLKRLYIKEYKLFKDFTYEFPADNQHYIHVLIGINGSGKSTILEAIAEIFSCVVLGEKAKFGFELEYVMKYESASVKSESGLYWSNIQYKDVLIKAPDSEQMPELLIKSDDEVVVFDSAPPKNQYNYYLPQSVVIYYAGNSKIMKEMCIPHNNMLLDYYIKGAALQSNQYYYYEPVLFKLILISLFSFEYGDIPIFLKEKAKISGFQSIEITLKRPVWAKDSAQNFWGAKGEILDFLKYLKLLATKEVHLVDGNGILIFEVTNDSFIQISIFGDRLYRVKDFLIEEKKLFKMLYALYINELIYEVNIEFLKEVNHEMIYFRDLSEGEQQAITIKGLTELLAGENTLFLFDEPDTFLHPRWQRNFIAEIEETIELHRPNELTYLIATHSPQILSNAKPDKTFVKIIENGQLVEQTPKHYGREISSILYNLMGVEERNEAIRRDLSKLFMLLEDEEIEKAEKELERLTEILGETDADVQSAMIQLNYLKDEAN